MTESEKMKLGLWYDANYDQELSEEREKAEDLYFTFNHTAPKEKALREDILKKLLPKKGERVTILSPFYTDYGYNCNIGSDCFINHNAYLMDCWQPLFYRPKLRHVYSYSCYHCRRTQSWAGKGASDYYWR